mmetsp:Transcript_65608/g.207525  ORF Transcript_65608/g.207525 Transcript_65608/m.207525 type:complete len:201 (-) Transcript_65608:669-1271(-)
MRSSRISPRPAKDPASKYLMRLRSRTSSRSLGTCSSPSILFSSLSWRNKTLMLGRWRRLSAGMLEIWLFPSCKTSRLPAPAPGSPSSGPRLSPSSRLWLSRSTCSCPRCRSADTSVSMLLSRLSSLRHWNSSLANTLPTSRMRHWEISRSRKCSKNRCPTFSSRKSRVSLPAYLPLAVACSAASMPCPSRTLSFRRWYIR